MNRLRSAALLLVVLSALGGIAISVSAADEKAVPNAKPAKSGGFIFSLLPKSLQKNPRLDFNIITEFTPAGRKVPRPSADKPAYYVSQAGGMHNTGVGVEESLKGPAPEQLQRLMERALADGSYRVSDGAAHPPSVVIIYHWGSSSFQLPADVSDENGQGNVPESEIVIRKTLLDRAMLLGGAKFTKEVADAMEESDRNARLQSTFSAPAGGSDFMASPMAGMPDPFDRLRTRSPEMDRLVDELFSSSFFVVASAYDYASLVKSERRLLWRTKMTVSSLGVNMAESVPPLIASAGPYLGRETSEPVVISKRISREGHVEVGTPIVIEPGNAPAPAPKPPAAGAKK